MTLFSVHKERRIDHTFCSQCKKFNWSATKVYTKYRCKICGTTYGHDTTYTPVYCDYCAKKQNICQRCGKSLG